MKNPVNWPSDIIYRNIQEFNGFKKIRKETTPGVRLEKINDTNSVLHNQYGLFATKEFNSYDIIGQYTGKLVDMECGGCYVSRSDNCCIDALNYGNELRFINDYRNIAPSENVVIKNAYIDKKPRVLFVVTKQIKPGEQILTDYGEEYWKHF